MAIRRTSFKTAAYVYDFAVDGGVVSTIQGGSFIPNNAVICFGHAKVITALTSGGAATIAVGWTGATGSLIAAEAVATWALAAVIAGVDLIVAMVEATANRQLATTIAAADLTAGVFVYACHYVEWDV